jgi:hypothetical protein
LPSTEEVTMIPSIPDDETRSPMTRVAATPRDEARRDLEYRQPEMSEPADAPANRDSEPVHWLVPDTRDDIVVSRFQD